MIPWAPPSPQSRQHLDRFSRFSPITAECMSLYFTMGRPFPSNCSFLWGRGSNTWFVGRTRVLKPNGISIGSAVFAGLTSVTDREAYRQTQTTLLGRQQYAASTYVVGILRCGLSTTTNVVAVDCKQWTLWSSSSTVSLGGSYSITPRWPRLI